ncbi:ABC transporter permease [Myroides injenensis]|uniref:ABC transporter permease n=1 Tax=Myroides injenensis TaxID=1183151 RepID=UPI0002893EEA|nr:ABC transporter permease [Myroides injenensis]
MLKNWLKIYWYNAMKHKLYLLLTIISLAVGIACVVLSFMYYEEESSYDQWNPYKDEVFVISSQLDEETIWMKLPYPFGDKIKESSDVVDYTYVNNYYDEGLIKVEGQEKEISHLLEVQSNFFDFFPFDIIEGDKKEPFSGMNTAIIRDKVAAYLFGDKSPIGEVVKFEQEDFIITGVYSLENKKSSINASILINSQDKNIKENESWGNFDSTIWLKLRDVNKKSNVEKLLYDLNIDNLYRRLAKEEGISIEDYLKNENVILFNLHPLSEQHLVGNQYLNGTPERGANIRMLKTVIVLSILILSLSIFNYINISMAQLIKRGKEIGIRKSLGATKRNLWSQSVLESGITTFLSMLVSLVIIEFAFPYVKVFLLSKMQLDLIRLLPSLIIIFFIVLLLVGGIPALFAMNLGSINNRENRYGFYLKGKILKRGILVLQFTVASFFIIGAMIVQQQLSYMLNKELGFKGDQVVSVYLGGNIPWEKKTETYFSLKEELQNVEGVADVSTSALMWDAGASSSRLYYGERSIQVENGGIDFNFFELTGIELKEGRMLSSSFASDSINNVVVNEEIVTKLDIIDPIGKVVNWNDNLFTIVGVVNNYHVFDLKNEYPSTIFMYLKTIPWIGNTVNFVFLKLDMENVDKTMMEVEKIMNKRGVVSGGLSYEFLDKTFQKNFGSTIRERNAFLVLNGIVVFIALFGLYSLASFNINNKLREVAIRKVLGANQIGLLRLLSKEYFVLAVIGFFIAIFPSYFFLNQWLNEYAFRINISVIPFILCFLLILVLTLAIVLYKSYKATKVDILKYIKYE